MLTRAAVPSASRQATATIRLLWDVSEALRSAGHDTRALFERHGLSEEMVSDPEQRISQRLLCDFWDEAEALSGTSAFGLHIGSNLACRGLPELLTYLMRNCATLREAIEVGIRYQRLCQEGRQGSLERLDAERTMWVWRALPGVRFSRAFSECALAYFARPQHWAGAVLATPALVEVHFPFEQPQDIREHEAFFQVPLRFGFGHQALVFAERALQTALPKADGVLKPLLLRLAETQLVTIPRAHSHADHVRNVLATWPDGHFDLEEVATRLGVSSRTLRRRLCEEATTFSDLADECRRERAQRYLALPGLSLTEIAFLLGFAEHNVFTRAFRRWFGVAPSTYRRRQLQHP